MNKEVLLSTVIDEISMGPFGSDIKVDNFISEGIPVLNGSNLTNVKLVEDSFNYVSKTKANSLGKAIARKGDIVVTHRGTLGQLSYIPDNSKHKRYVISQSQFRVRFNKEISPVYIAYLFKTNYGQKKLLSFKNHVGVPALAQATTNFKQLELYLHNYIDQQHIASVLSFLDDKIELNNRINAELQAMTITLYDYWFVQFDFPNANGKPYKSSDGKMVYNKKIKREIPEGWKVKTLFEITSLIRRGISPKYVEDRGYLVLNQKCIRNQTITFGLGRRHDNKLSINDERFIKLGDVLVNSTGVGTLGRVAFIKYTQEEKTTVDSHVTIVRGNPDLINIEYLNYWMLKSEKDIERAAEGSTGQIELRKEFLENMLIISPSDNIQKKFSNMVTPLNREIACREKENQHLVSLRDWLLPMLMNGQVEFNEDYHEQAQSVGTTTEAKIEFVS